MEKLHRRDFLGEAAKSILAEPTTLTAFPYVDPSNKVLPADLRKTSTGLSPYLGSWSDTEKIHLLRRTLFGVTKADMDFFRTNTVTEMVDYLLTVPSVLPAPPLNNYSVNTNQPDPEVPYGQTWVNAAINPNIESARRASLKAWWTGLMLNQDRNIREKLTLFWHNHFSTEGNTIQDSRYFYKHHNLLRNMCLGNFKDLVKLITTDPAMLVYLNGDTNTKTAPDENYGRELQELFTVGKDLPQHYTEEDVKAAAKVLTGWRNNRTGINSYFDPTKHDSINKTFSSFYNNTVITGRTGNNAGMDELTDLINMIFAQQEVAKYICRKIYRYFVYYLIDSTVETNIINPLATILRNNNYDIKPVLNTLFKSEHFFDTLNMGCMIKQPMDHVIGLSRQMNLVFPGSGNTQQQYAHWLFMQQYGVLLNQDIGDPPNVAGWAAFYENPQFHELWINSDSLPKRNQLCDYFIYAGYSRFSFKTMFDCVAFAAQFNTPGLPDALIDQMVALFYAVPVSANVKNTLKVSFLLSGQLTNSYWTDAWNAYAAAPTNASLKTTVNTRLQGLIKYLMGQAEYQLC